MKKKNLIAVLLLMMAMFTTSCYTYTHTVGEGPQTGVVVKEKNHFFIGGLAKGKHSDPRQMANNAKDYQVTTQFTFVDMLLNAITLGIYSPTTTTVQR